MPPTVQDYNTIYAGLGSVYDPQMALVNKEMGDVDTQAAAEQSGLDQAKVNAFKTIENRSNSRGVLFSGVTPDEQLTYTGSTYLPAVARLKTATTNSKNTLTGQINKIQADRATQAQSTLTAEQKAYNDYLDKQSTAAYRNAQLDLGYKRLAVSQSRAAAASNKPLTSTQTIGAIHDFLQANKGSDNHVAPSVLASAYTTFLSAGGSDAAFWKNYQGYWNPKQGNYKQMFNAAKAAR